MTEIYIKTVEMELRVARYMLRAYVIPAGLKNQKLLLDAVNGFPADILKKAPSILDRQLSFIGKFTHRIDDAMKMLALLDEDNEALKKGTNAEKAKLCSNTIRPHILETGELVEKIEDRVDHQFWEIPRVTDILFR